MADGEDQLTMVGQEEPGEKAVKADVHIKPLAGDQILGKETAYVNGLSHEDIDGDSAPSQMDVDSDPIEDLDFQESMGAGLSNGEAAPPKGGANGDGTKDTMDVQGSDDPASGGPDKNTGGTDDVAVTTGSTANEGVSGTGPSEGDDEQGGGSAQASDDSNKENSSSQVDGNSDAKPRDDNDADVQIISNPSKPEDDVIVIDDDDDDDDGASEPAKPEPKPTRKKSSQAALCKCILCGEMVRLSTLGVHVNSTHSKLIVKGNSDIECKVCLESYDWNNFVDHAQTKHKWSIVKNSATKVAPPASQLRKDYDNMGICCMWCKENTDVSVVASHFKQVHKVDEKVIDRALHLKEKRAIDKDAPPIPTGIMGAFFVTCQECPKNMKFSEVIPHFQDVHRFSKRKPDRSSPAQTTNGTTVQPQPSRATVPSTVVKPPAQAGRTPIPPAKPLNPDEQLITLFKGQLNPAKSPDYALVKLAHDGKDKILSIPFSHPIAKHRVHTIAVKGKLDDIPALIQSVTDMLAVQSLPPPAPDAPQSNAKDASVKAPEMQAGKTPEVSVVSTVEKKLVSQDPKTSDGSKSCSTRATTDSDIEEIPTSDSEGKKTVVDKSQPNKSHSGESSEKEKDTTGASDEKSGGEDTSSKKKEDEEGEGSTSPSKSSPKKGSPRGSFNRLLELQKESLATREPAETNTESPGTPLRRSSRRAKLAAKAKIKSVVEKEVQDWKKQLEQPEYVPGEDEEEEKRSLAKQNVTYVASNKVANKAVASQWATKAIEQYIFRSGQGGQKVLVRVPVQTNAQRQTTLSRFVTPAGTRTTQGSVASRFPSSTSSMIGQYKASTLPMAQMRQVGTLSPIAPKKKTPVILQQRSPINIQTSPLRSPILTATSRSPQISTTTILPSGITIQTPGVYQQQTAGQMVLRPAMQTPGYIIQQPQPSLTFVQPTTLLQQNFGVQLQPQTVPIQNPNMMMVPQQNRLQLVTTAQGQQILVMPQNSNVVQNQPVVLNQMQQNSMIIGSVGSQSSVKNVASQPVVQQTSVNAANSQRPFGRVTRSLSATASVAPAPQPTIIATKAIQTVTGPPTKVDDLDPYIIKRGKDQLVRLSDLQKLDKGYVCHQSDISLASIKETVVRKVPLVKKPETPVPVTKADSIGFQSKRGSDDFLSKYAEFDKMVKINVLTESIVPADLPDIPSVMFECSRCGRGLPTFMLLRMHLADCFANPPAEEQAYIIRLPFPLLQMYYNTGVEPGGVVSCKLCSKIIPRSNNKDLAPLQAHVREHQAQNTAQKGGSVTFGVLSLNKVCVLKCKICGEGVLRLWQDVAPMSVHLQKHIKGNVEILCNQPPVVALTSKPHAQHISKKAYTWVDYIVPPFTMENPPISEKQRNLDHHVATHGILHYESLLPRRKRRHMLLAETPRLRGKANQAYQSNLKPLMIETSTADTRTSYDIKPGKTNLLHSIKLMPSPNKMKGSTLTASIPIKAKHKTFMGQSTGSNRRKIFRQGQYRSARLQEKREKYIEEMDEAAAAGTDSPLNPSTPVKEQEMTKESVHPVTCIKSPGTEKLNVGKVSEARVESPVATQMLKRLADPRTSRRREDKPKRDSPNGGDSPGVDNVNADGSGSSPKEDGPAAKKVHVPNPEMATIPDESSDDEVTEVPLSEPSGGGKGTAYVEPAMPPRTPSPEKPETPPPPITEGDIEDYLHILEGCEEEEKQSTVRPLPEIGDVSLSDYFGDSANTSILCEPLIIEQAQAPMYFTRSANTGYRFKCSFRTCEAAVPNNTLVMLAHLSQHFRVRIAGDFSQNGSVIGHRRTCKSLPLTINQVAAHFTLSDREEASLHGGEVQMAYVCQWRSCSRTRTFKKGLITHLYRHVTFHLISDAQHTALKERSKPLKLSSAQFVPHGSGTKLITESMNTIYGFNKNKDPKLLGLLNKADATSRVEMSTGNYGDGSPLGSLIARLSKQVLPGEEAVKGASAAGPEKCEASSKDGETDSAESGSKTEGGTGEAVASTEDKTPTGGPPEEASDTKGASSDGKRKHEAEGDGDQDDETEGPSMKKVKVDEGESEREEAAEPGRVDVAEEKEEGSQPPAKRAKTMGDDSPDAAAEPGKVDVAEEKGEESQPPAKRAKTMGDDSPDAGGDGSDVGEVGEKDDRAEVDIAESTNDVEDESGREDSGGVDTPADMNDGDGGKEQLHHGEARIESKDTPDPGEEEQDAEGTKESELDEDEELNGSSGAMEEGGDESDSLPPPLLPEPLNESSLSGEPSEGDEPMPDLELVGPGGDRAGERAEESQTDSSGPPELDSAGEGS